MKKSHGFIGIALLVILSIIIVGGVTYVAVNNSKKNISLEQEQKVAVDNFDFKLFDKNNESDETPSDIVDTTESNSNIVFNFKMPNEYVTGQEWPPKLSSDSSNYTCSLILANELEKISEKTILGEKYCIKISSEGAMGHLYRNYTYKKQIPTGTKTAEFTFVSQNCSNYDEPIASKCLNIQKEFNNQIDSSLDLYIADLMK